MNIKVELIELVSYRQRHNFLLFGACEEEMKKHVRKPKEDELRGID